MDCLAFEYEPHGTSVFYSNDDSDGLFGYQMEAKFGDILSHYTDPLQYREADAADEKSNLLWDIIMRWDGEHYTLHRWTVEHLNFGEHFEGSRTGCESSNDDFIPRFFSPS